MKLEGDSMVVIKDFFTAMYAKKSPSRQRGVSPLSLSQNRT